MLGALCFGDERVALLDSKFKVGPGEHTGLVDLLQQEEGDLVESFHDFGSVDHLVSCVKYRVEASSR